MRTSERVYEDIRIARTSLLTLRDKNGTPRRSFYTSVSHAFSRRYRKTSFPAQAKNFCCIRTLKLNHLAETTEKCQGVISNYRIRNDQNKPQNKEKKQQQQHKNPTSARAKTRRVSLKARSVRITPRCYCGTLHSDFRAKPSEKVLSLSHVPALRSRTAGNTTTDVGSRAISACKKTAID